MSNFLSTCYFDVLQVSASHEQAKQIIVQSEQQITVKLRVVVQTSKK